MELSLIGVSDFDLQRYRRAVQILEYLKPDCVGLDITKEEMDTLEKEWMKYFNHSAFVSLDINCFESSPKSNPKTRKEFVLSVGSLELAVYTYTLANSAKLLHCAPPGSLMPTRMSNMQIGVHEMGNLLEMSLEAVEKHSDFDYAKEEHEVRRLPFLTARYYDHDEYIQRSVKSRQTPRNDEPVPRHITIFTSLEHIYGDYPHNLYSRLEEFKPVRYKLIQADNLVQTKV